MTHCEVSLPGVCSGKLMLESVGATVHRVLQRIMTSFATRFADLRRRRDDIGQWLTERQKRPYQCTHRRREPRSYRQSDNRWVAREQCLSCGHVGRALALRSLPPLEALKPVDEGLTARRGGYTWDYYRLRQAFRARDAKKWSRLYTEYLESPHWAAKRDQVLARARRTCEGCLQRKPLQVHHTDYSNIGDELLFQLVALCRDCHARVHRQVA